MTTRSAALKEILATATAPMVAPSVRAELLAEASPCDGCHFAEQCRRDDIACAAFASFASGAPPLRWQLLQRVPTRAHWESVFGS